METYGDYSQACESCYENSFCNGLDVMDCDMANAVKCLDGLIKECKQFYYLNGLTSSCSLCTEINSSLKGCEKQPTCERGTRREGFKCIECVYGWYCDGNETAHDCYNQNNALSAVLCNGSHVIKCKDGMKLIREENRCEKCLAIESTSIFPYCDGVSMVQCYLGAVNKKLVLQLGEGENVTCALCPLDSVCDGVNVVRCELGWKIAASKKFC